MCKYLLNFCLSTNRFVNHERLIYHGKWFGSMTYICMIIISGAEFDIDYCLNVKFGCLLQDNHNDSIE